jgi:myo-inositol-1(or 4)-monophosphatase
VAAHAALDEAVAILRDGRARPHERITKAAKDFLTDVDLASESAMQRSLAASTPEIGFYGEEGGAAALDSGKVWVADPLDGTINYATGSPLCGVMLGLLETSQSRSGYVHTRSVPGPDRPIRTTAAESDRLPTGLRLRVARSGGRTRHAE